MPCITVVPMWNPMACSFSFALGSAILDECKFKIILGPPFPNAGKFGKLNNVGKVVRGRPPY